MKKILLVVDPQIDFITGSLPVGGAADAMDALADFIRKHDGDYDYKLITTDWHPYNHCSFTPQGGLWPVHCVQNSVGASVWPTLLEALYQTKGEVVVLRKGNKVEREEYSIFNNRKSHLYISRLLASHPVDRIDICGLAGDICVLNTLKDGVAKYGKSFFHVLEDYAPSLDGGAALKQFIEKK